MKLKSKQTGEIIEFDAVLVVKDVKGGEVAHLEYDSIQNLTDQWEDYEEPEGMQWVDVLGANDGRVVIQYSNEEEAEKAVEKLKAWKRLKDAGLSFTGFEDTDRGCLGDFTIYCWIKPDYTRPYDDVKDDLLLLFGGEE